ncbi:ATP-binding protein [Magnetospirillum sulfuroxidans]|uniref:histidine kinase n=1 Tax=Magnetospirillum sulfuroxidans TaxID=611300 RepID=A0ABS5I7J3_9PROT|nr:ATP-binding protein [Magnetospirillum sulfuroxidans]MBR9970107.1 PAS domain S-box protein [Magnetospirillum sulfuroxidans]
MLATRGTDWIWALILMALAVLMATWDIVSMAGNRRAEAEERLDALARVVEARTNHTLQSINALLRDADAELDMSLPPGDQTYHRYLTTRARFEPHALTITVVTLDGNIVHSTNPVLVGQNVGERSYLRYFQTHPQANDLFVAEPVISLLQRTVIFAALPSRDDSGKLRAIMVTALAPSLFSDIVEAALPSEPSGAISVTNSDHTILARAPSTDNSPIGRSLAKVPLRLAHLATGKAASIQEGPGAIDGMTRIIALRTVAPWGLIIGVSATRDDILRPILPRLIGDTFIVILISAFAIALVRMRDNRKRGREIAQEQVAKARDYYMQVLDEMPTLVRRMDDAGQCQYVNATWSTMTGQSLAEAQGQGWLSVIHPEDRANLGNVGEHDYRLVCIDGGDAWIHEVARPLRDPDGTLMGLLASGIDITEARHFQEKLQQSNAELEQFAYVASHDMREPLRMINSYMGLIERRMGTDLSTEIKEFIAFARDGAERMDRLIQDLLQYSRIGRLSAPKAMIDLNVCLAKAQNMLGLAMTEQSATVSACELPTLFASSDDMVRLFQNLIANAIKYHQPGLPPRVVIDARRQTGAWCISVSDNGIGISRDFFDRIFRIFQRLHGRDEHGGGSGIGLSICKKIVESHGGHIWVDSPGPNQGSVFCFTLPA